MNGKNTYYVDFGSPGRYVEELYSGPPRAVGRYVIFDGFIESRTRHMASSIIVNEDDRTYWLKKNRIFVHDQLLSEVEYAELMLQILRSEKWTR